MSAQSMADDLPLDTPTGVQGQIVEVTQHAIATFDPFETELAEFRERYEGVVYDLDDDVQNKRARSDKLIIGKVIARLDRQHAAVKAPLLDATRRLDGRRKDIKDKMLAVQGPIKGQLEAHEAKEKARVDEHYAAIQAIRVWAEGTEVAAASELEAYLQNVKAESLDDFEEFKADALLAKTETIEALEKFLAERQQYEAEQAELERLRAEKAERERADREARIAAEAAQNAKEKAEREAAHARQQVERERQEEVDRAARELDEANKRAERAAAEERGRIKRDQEKADREAAHKLAEEEARKAKRAHRVKITNEAKAAFVSTLELTDEAFAQELMDVIASGAIPHVKIVY